MIGIGILGAGNIAHRFVASLGHDKRAQVVAAACRSEEKARAFLREVEAPGAAHAWGDYGRLLEDADVDAIYLALPHVLHATWASEALMAGKPVLCEKPATVDAAEMGRLAQLSHSEGVLFMEAMKPRFQPLYPLVREASAQIGDIVRVEATLCNDMLSLVAGSGTYHLQPGRGAGVLLDCGTYCASWIDDYTARDAGLTLMGGSFADREGIDVYADAELRVGGCEARLECAFDRAKPRTATLVGTRGRLVVDELHRPQSATLQVDDRRAERIDAPYVVDDFFGEVTHFLDLLEAGASESPVMPLSASVRCAELLDLVREGFEDSRR